MTIESTFHFHWIATFKEKCESKAKMTVESPFHFHWIVIFREKCEGKAKMTVESPFHFIELRLSKKITKRTTLPETGLGCGNKTKITVESPFLFHWIATFKKKVWTQRQKLMTAKSSFHFHWVATFKKDQRLSDLDLESKTKMTAESPFHFIWIATFKQDDYNTGWPLLWKQSKITVESPSHFNELRLWVTFCCKRKGHDMLSLEFDKLKTFIFPVVGFMSLPKICTVSAKPFLLRLLCKV